MRKRPVCGISLAAMLMMSSPVLADVDQERAKAFAEFIRPAYPLFLAQAGAWESDPQRLASSADRAATGLSEVAPADCDAARFKRDLCGLKLLRQPSTSMAPTLQESEFVVRKGYSAGEQPRRGDIVTFDTVPAYSNQPSTYVKRIIGMPGEAVELREGVVLIDGKALTQTPTERRFDSVLTGEIAIYTEAAPDGRRYDIGISGNPQPSMDNAGPFHVPEGHYFVLGDNRHNSADSRFPDQMGSKGFVPADSISGRIVTILVSKDQERIGLVVD
ncbi:signal peptidase I [Rhizobium sp. NFR07]|uniref:signal peptidase I n=1 Tax=Rhizobium sp. NFR07 TaxID=1566262 RepID=UPI0008DFE8BC|nr:signal peptidase I [Rhizobium sp. NFR07]SFB45655.1 signal peptidase I [Rhizobium sp. NFR07]